MGHTTDFLGHIEITPGLNDAEASYLAAFHRLRHWDRPDGPYALPGNPYADERHEVADMDAYNRPSPGTPQLYCQWEVCHDHCCLAFDGNEKFYRPVEWLEYLIAHFLRPGALASRSRRPEFEDFTFDHTLAGVVVACRRDIRELSAICVDDNVVSERVIMGGLDGWRRHPPLSYTEHIDRWIAQRGEWRGLGNGPRLNPA